MKKLNQDLNSLLMKKLILMNNSRLILTYSFFFLLINILVGLNSLNFYSGEQYGYWYFIKNGTTMNTKYDIKDYFLTAS